MRRGNNRGGERQAECRARTDLDANFHAARALILIKYVRVRDRGEISGTKGNLYGDAAARRSVSKIKIKDGGREEKVSRGISPVSLGLS